MAYCNESLEAYVAAAASGEPTPGGGSASAAAGAIGAAMACMAANFTVGRKKFKAVEEQVAALLETLNTARRNLLDYVDADAMAYAGVSRAYGMPKDTDEQKAERSAAIQDALKAAMATPLNIFDACCTAIGTLYELAHAANPNLISDVGVAAALLGGALEGAVLNVEINLAFLKDSALVAETRAHLEANAPKAREAARKVLDKILAGIRQ
jgi:methenyltetrahydrofolate cyclohydrolase